MNRSIHTSSDTIERSRNSASHATNFAKLGIAFLRTRSVIQFKELELCSAQEISLTKCQYLSDDINLASLVDYENLRAALEQERAAFVKVNSFSEDLFIRSKEDALSILNFLEEIHRAS